MSRLYTSEAPALWLAFGPLIAMALAGAMALCVHAWLTERRNRDGRG